MGSGNVTGDKMTGGDVAEVTRFGATGRTRIIIVMEGVKEWKEAGLKDYGE